MPTGRPLRFGLVAHRLHRREATGGLARWLNACRASLLESKIELHAVGATFDAIAQQGLLPSYPGLARLPYGSEGGVVRLVSRITGGLEPSAELDGVIYLLDPTDSSSTYPETQALRRQCVIHGKTLIPTVAGAIEWIEVEARLAIGNTTNIGNSPEHAKQTVALIAHDALKEKMVDFASQHFDLLSSFKSRVATGTTGARLNTMAWARGWPQSKSWVHPYLSGPLGGDAQIAEMILDRQCQKVIFYEDPHVARQHEADIQLLERAVCTATQETTCFNSPAMAERWARSLA